MATVLTWINVVALLGVGGLFTLYALIPFAMANDDPRCGPLLRHGVLQLAGLGGLAASVLLGAWVAHHAVDHAGWTAIGVGAAGWGAWVGGVVLTMTLFFTVSALDTAVAERRRRAASSRD
ncbi:hypothetical protein [Actinomycetospora sp. TBRC 11914]|uniref:hypothetical protein n=1 Tax=Actinomycetospora sp. TBRC 11914 TaxID=2729387 RepID=UPI00145DF049|nr:hypothetical protein [Actinomycetospora sp. TBRC 11914]NMO89366.1 hypothetical protein [Actinomycetospora sp. TBRC 11914]